MSDTQLLTGVDLSLLDYHTGPVRNLKPLCIVEEYIANYDTVDWLDVARFLQSTMVLQRARRIRISCIVTALDWFIGDTG